MWYKYEKHVMNTFNEMDQVLGQNSRQVYTGGIVHGFRGWGTEK